MVDNFIFTSAALSSSRTPLSFLLYTDPGAGALLWQLLLASLVGGSFYARLLIRRARARIAGLKRAGSAAQLALDDGRPSQATK